MPSVLCADCGQHWDNTHLGQCPKCKSSRTQLPNPITPDAELNMTGTDIGPSTHRCQNCGQIWNPRRLSGCPRCGTTVTAAVAQREALPATHSTENALRI